MARICIFLLLNCIYTSATGGVIRRVLKEKRETPFFGENKLRLVLFPPYSSRQAALALKTTPLTLPPANPSRFC